MIIFNSNRLVFIFFFITLFSTNSLMAASVPNEVSLLSRNEWITKLYGDGERLFVNHQWSEAQRKFRLLNFQYPDHPYIDKTQLYIMQCCYGKKAYSDGLKEVNNFILNYPNHPELPHVYNMKADFEKMRTQMVVRKGLVWTANGVGFVSLVLFSLSHYRVWPLLGSF